MLGFENECRKYDHLADHTKKAFQKRFYNEKKGSYGDAGGNILALRMGVPDDQHERVVTALKAGLKSCKGHLDTGIIGTRFFFEVLAENGLQELAYEALNKRTEPGYGHWLELGSTTTRENWNEEGSHNHPMFGGGLVWFYRNLAGMWADAEQPGYRHIIFRPQPVDQLEYVSYFNKTPYGEGGITWKNEEKSFNMDIVIPVSSTATVFVPAEDQKNVLENGQRHDLADGVKFLRMEDGYAVFTVESGKYSFQVLE